MRPRTVEVRDQLIVLVLMLPTVMAVAAAAMWSQTKEIDEVRVLRVEVARLRFDNEMLRKIANDPRRP